MELNQFLASIHAEDNRKKFLATAAGLIAMIAVLDASFNTISLGSLYFFPVLLASGFLGRGQIFLLAAGCALLRELFYPLPMDIEAIPRSLVIFTAYLGAGWFIRESALNRRLIGSHLKSYEEQVRLRRDAEQQLRVLIESSPAAILTLDEMGRVCEANEAAHQMLAFEGQRLEGEAIDAYLPVMAHLRDDRGKEFLRTAIEARGRRKNGEAFLAHIWLSTFNTSSGPRLAAIVLDGSEEMRDREETGLHHLLASSRILVGAVSHEIRNLCGAITMVHANLIRFPDLAVNEDFKALGILAEALRKIASAELRPSAEAILNGIDMFSIFEDLRIVVSPSLQESGTEIVWDVPEELPLVLADHHGMLQVFLNLVQNSQRAMRTSAKKQVMIRASVTGDRVLIRVLDTGPGIANPERLFQPFQQGADVTGLGLCVSRAIVRAFSGDLHYEPASGGSCFVLGLVRAEPASGVAA